MMGAAARCGKPGGIPSLRQMAKSRRHTKMRGMSVGIWMSLVSFNFLDLTVHCHGVARLSASGRRNRLKSHPRENQGALVSSPSN